MRTFKNILVTGGAGFIGCNFIRYLLEKAEGFSGRVINLDALTYAGNRISLADIEAKYGTRYFFEKGDICDRSLVESLFAKYEIDTVVHFAAESHVDRSILGPEAFVKTKKKGFPARLTGILRIRNGYRAYAPASTGSVWRRITGSGDKEWILLNYLQ